MIAQTVSFALVFTASLVVHSHRILPREERSCENARYKRDVYYYPQQQEVQYIPVQTKLASRSGFTPENTGSFISTRLHNPAMRLSGEDNDYLMQIPRNNYYNPWYEQTAPKAFKTTDKYHVPLKKYHSSNDFYMENRPKYNNQKKNLHYPGLVYLSPEDVSEEWDVPDELFIGMDDLRATKLPTVLNGKTQLVEDAAKVYDAGILEDSELTAEYHGIFDKEYLEDELDTITIDKVQHGIEKPEMPFFPEVFSVCSDEVPVIQNAGAVENSELTAETHNIENTEIVEKEKQTSTQEDVVIEQIIPANNKTMTSTNCTEAVQIESHTKEKIKTDVKEDVVIEDKEESSPILEKDQHVEEQKQESVGTLYIEEVSNVKDDTSVKKKPEPETKIDSSTKQATTTEDVDEVEPVKETNKKNSNIRLSMKLPNAPTADEIEQEEIAKDGVEEEFIPQIKPRTSEHIQVVPRKSLESDLKNEQRRLEMRGS